MPVHSHEENEFPRLPVRQQRQGPLPYSLGKRAFYGITWTVWTLLLFIGGISAMTAGSVAPALLMPLLGFLTATYAWRIWTWQAKRLWFLIIF
jgi:Zn-dependent protease with chaperone function